MCRGCMRCVTSRKKECYDGHAMAWHAWMDDVMMVSECA